MNLGGGLSYSCQVAAVSANSPLTTMGSRRTHPQPDRSRDMLSLEFHLIAGCRCAWCSLPAV